MGQLNSRYYQAAIDGDVNKIEHYIRQGANVNYRGKKKKTALWQACANDDEQMVEDLLQRGANPELSDNEGWTPLLKATHSGNLQIVKSLVEYSANVNQKSTTVGRFPLRQAAFYGHHEIVEFLIENGADVNLVDNRHGTALYMAAKKGKDEVVSVLLQAGAQPNTAVVDRSTPLYIACQCGHDAVVQLLLEAGARKEIKDKSGATAMMVAVRYNHLSVLKTMAKAGCDLNAVNNHGDTALHYAAFHGYKEIVEFLLESNAHITTNKRSQEPIHLAEMNGNKEIVVVFKLYSPASSSLDIGWNQKGQAMQDAVNISRTSNSSHTEDNVDAMINGMPPIGESPPASPSTERAASPASEKAATKSPQSSEISPAATNNTSPVNMEDLRSQLDIIKRQMQEFDTIKRKVQEFEKSLTISSMFELEEEYPGVSVPPNQDRVQDQFDMQSLWKHLSTISVNTKTVKHSSDDSSHHSPLDIPDTLRKKWRSMVQFLGIPHDRVTKLQEDSARGSGCKIVVGWVDEHSHHSKHMMKETVINIDVKSH